MQLVVLAAGKGTRLRPVTDHRSKAMVPVLGEPLVARAVAPWLELGVRELVVVVGPGDREIRELFSRSAGREPDVAVVEQRHRRGMADALAAAAPLVRGDFAVTACDSLIPGEVVGRMLGAHRPGSAVLSLMDVAPDLVARSASVVCDGDRVRRIVEKPAPGAEPSSTVSLPHYVLPRRILDILPGLAPSPRGEIELQGAIQRLIDADVRVTGVRTSSRSQVSSPDDLLALNLDLLRRSPSLQTVEPERIGPGTTVDRPVRIEPAVVVGRDCRIGPDVYLEGGSIVGDGAVVRGSVVLRGARVPDGRLVDGELVC